MRTALYELRKWVYRTTTPSGQDSILHSRDYYTRACTKCLVSAKYDYPGSFEIKLDRTTFNASYRCDYCYEQFTPQTKEERKRKPKEPPKATADPAPSPNRIIITPEYRILHLLPDAPMEVVTAAFRAMAILHHPDKGGDTEKMKKINNAYDKIRKDRGIC